MGALGFVHLHKPSFAPDLDCAKVILEVWEVVLRLGSLARNNEYSAMVARRVLGRVGMYTGVQRITK